MTLIGRHLHWHQQTGIGWTMNDKDGNISRHIRHFLSQGCDTNGNSLGNLLSPVSHLGRLQVVLSEARTIILG